MILEKEQERAAILRVDKEWATAVAEARDIERIVSFLADDAIMFPPGTPAVVGKDSIRQFVEKSLQTPGFSIRWETTDVIVSQDGKLAYATGKNQTTFHDPKGKQITVLGKGVTVWRKETSGVWKCVIDIWNEDPLSSQNTSGVREAIDLNNANAVRWYAAGDIDSLASIFSKDAWQMPPNSSPLVGRQAICEFWRQAFQWGKWEFTLEAQEVDIGGSIAVERGKYVLRFTAGPGAPPGMASFEDRGNYLAHWRHESDGQWRIVGDAPVSELRLNSQNSQ